MLKYVLIAEDHPICAEAIKFAAQRQDSAIFTETCETLAQAQEHLSLRKFDALVLDLGLKDSRGLINLRLIRASYPDLPILIISGAAPGPALAARQLGAQGYLNKAASLDVIGKAITDILEGRLHFEHAENDELDRAFEGIEQLSRAQLKVMNELRKGLPNKLIAHELGISEPTVKSHISAIFKALNVTNRSQAILALERMEDDHIAH